LLRELDAYEGCGEGFAEPTQYIRQMLPVTLNDQMEEAWTYLYNWPVAQLPASPRAVSGEVGLLAPSFRGASKTRTRNLEIPRCAITHLRFALNARPGMTAFRSASGARCPRHARFFGFAFCCM